MSYIRVTDEELQSVSTQLSSAADSINQINAAAMSQVSGLVGAGWEGAASAQFEALFRGWKQGADQVQEALAGIGGLLRGAAAAYAETERQIQQSMTH